MQIQSGVLARLVNCFFEGVTKPQRFVEGLRLLADMLECDQASIKFWDRRSGWACLRSAQRLDRGWKLAAEDLPAPKPEWKKFAASLEPGCWNRVAIVTKESHSQSLSAAFAPAYGSLMCLRLSTTKGAEGLLLLKQSTEEASDGASHRLPAELIKSLITALELMAQFRQLSYRAVYTSVLFDTIRLPLLMLDDSLRLLAANRHAQPLIERFTLGSGKQCVSLKGLSSSRFSAAVREACDSSSRALGSVLQSEAVGKSVRQVLVLPLLIRRPGKTERTALILVHGQHDSGESQASGQTLLQQTYGLTPAEARLAIGILEGHSPGDLAISQQISVATVRTQLSAILKKTGARKQAELIRRLSPLLMLDRQHAAH